MNQSINYYVNKFSKLNVNRSKERGFAPHKPILLLSAIELIGLGAIATNQIPLSAELIATFLRLWQHLGSTNHDANIGLPFYHLTGDRFWHLKANPGFEMLFTSGAKVKRVGLIRQAVEYAYFDDELFQFLLLPTTRNILVNTLLQTWFTNKVDQARSILQVNALAELELDLRSLGGKVYTLEELEDEQTKIVRDATFRRVIISVYEYRCAFCGLQIINSLAQNIVDGAHIKPFSQFYDDRIDNGLSLCKNHHWAFDRGWFTVNDDYTIVVAEQLREDSPHARPMREFGGDRILLPSQHQYYPRVEALRWHRENVFQAA